MLWLILAGTWSFGIVPIVCRGAVENPTSSYLTGFGGAAILLIGVALGIAIFLWAQVWRGVKSIVVD